jgi:hypothetical protein
MIPPVRSSVKQQARLWRSKRMGQHRELLTPEERARIMQLQDLLIDRFVEHREATAARQEERVKIVEAEIESSARKGRDREMGGCGLGPAARPESGAEVGVALPLVGV